MEADLGPARNSCRISADPEGKGSLQMFYIQTPEKKLLPHPGPHHIFCSRERSDFPHQGQLEKSQRVLKWG